MDQKEDEKGKADTSDRLERWKQKEPRRWRFEFVIKVFAILLPFAIIWITNQQQLNRQRASETQKAMRLLDGIRMEIMENFELLNRTYLDDSSKKVLDPEINLDSVGTMVFQIPNMGFSTRLWNTTTISDLVLPTSAGFYDTLNVLYTTFAEFNRSLGKLQELHEAAYLKRAEGTVPAKDFVGAAGIALRDAKGYLDFLRQGQPMIKTYIDTQLERVKSSL